MAQPEISVVIPTYRRELRLATALESLAEQTLDRERFEVLVVRPPGADPPFASAPDGLNVRSLTSAALGASTQRNCGWRAARAPLVAFTDDDCRATPEWLERLLDAGGDASVIVQGRTEPDPDERHRLCGPVISGLARSVEITGPSPWYQSCNIAYPKRLLEQLGGFDESFQYPWGEDTDLGWRAQGNGAELVYVDEALVWHAVLVQPLHRAVWEARRRRVAPRLFAAFPEQRRSLYWWIFVDRDHATLAFALAGMLAFRRRPVLAAAASAPYLASLLKQHLHRFEPTPRNLARFAIHVPALAAIQLAEVAATLEGSVRYRALLI